MGVLMAQPDWTAIFSVREDLRPPGYDETFLDMVENPRERPKRGKSSGKGKEARFPSLKHGAT